MPGKHGLKFNWNTLLAIGLPIAAPWLANWANQEVSQTQAHHGAITLPYLAALAVLGLLGGLLHGKALATPPADAATLVAPKTGGML